MADFFSTISVSATSFQSTPDIIFPFQTQGLLLLNEGTGTVQYSTNGSTIAGELNSATVSAGLIFDFRRVAKLYFIVKSGSSGPITVRIDAWS